MKMFMKNKLLFGIILSFFVILALFIAPENKFLNIRNFIFMEFIIVELIFFYKLSKTPNRLVSFLIVFLPLNYLITIISFHFLGISGVSLNIFKAWKDLLLLIAIIYWGIFFIKNPNNFKLKNKKVFTCILLFTAVELLYIVLPIGPANILQKLYSFRTDTFYLIFFVLGILIPKLDLNKIMKLILYTAIVFSCFAIIERFISPIQLLIWLGIPDYTFYINGGLPKTAGGLPYTYWAVGGIRRVGSLLLNPLDFAAFCLFAFPTIFIINDFKKRIIISIILGLGVIFSLSRMPILILCLQVMVILFLKYGNFKNVFLRGIGLIGSLVILAFAFFDKFRNYIINTVTFKEPSAQGHLHDWMLAINNLFKHPFGMGLGTSGSAGARYGNFGGGENQYLILGVQVGWIGLMVFIVMILTILVFLIKTYKENKRINLWLISNLLFLAISGITQQSFLNITITCITFLSLGFILKERKTDDKQES